ncbi:MAG: tetratricopeptide repeat protein [Vicinamibacterales bacterium]
MATRRQLWLFVLFGISVFALGCSRNPEEAMRRHLAAGDKYLADGKVAEAIIEYRNAVQQQPNAGPARQKLAETYLKANDPAKALPELVRAADLLPEDLALQVKAGNVLLIAGRFDDARARADKVLERDPKNLPGHLLLANSLAGLKDLDAAVSQIQEAISLSPERGATYSQLGVMELGRKNAEAAEKAFKKATEMDPTSVEAEMALANFYWVTGRGAEAESALKKSVEIAPENATANRALATFYIATNRAADAEAYLQKAYEITKTPAAALTLADFYVARNADDRAIAILEPMSRDAKTASEAGVRLAALDNKRGRRAKAYERLDSVLSTDKTNLQALLLKTELLMADQKIEEAFPVASAAVEAHKNSAPALFTLGRVQAARRQTEEAIKAYEGALRANPRATQAKVALAQLHLSRGQSETSVQLAEEAVRSQPRNVQAKLLLVQGLMTRGELQRAEAELEPLVKQYPQSAAVQVRMGMLRGLQNRGAEARKHFDQAGALAPDSLEVLGGQVALDLASKNVQEARRRVDERLQKGTPTGPLLMMAARVYAASGDQKGAEELLRRTVQTDPGQLQAYAALGQLYVRQGKLDVARAEFENLAKRDPKPVGALTMIGTIQQMQGQPDAARASYEKAVELDPDAAVAANNLAWIYATQGGNLDVALQLAQSAKRKLPDNPDVNDTLGYIYYKKDLHSLAIPALKASLAKNANSPIYHSHLGLAYAKAGDVENARQHLSSALKLQPDFEGAQEARRVLEGLPVR